MNEEQTNAYSADTNLLPMLSFKVALCDHRTAAVLLKHGADPFMHGVNARVTQMAPLMHQAAQGGCHQIVAAMLDAAARTYASPSKGLSRMTVLRDQFGRTAEAVALDPMSKCLLHQAKHGILPVEAECNRSGVTSPCSQDNDSLCAGKVGDINGGGGDLRQQMLRYDATAWATGMAAAALAASSVGIINLGAMGWRSYEGSSPLMHGMSDASNDVTEAGRSSTTIKCDILEFNGFLTAGQFYKHVQSRGRPAIFRSAARDWPARKRWTPQYLIDKTPNHAFSVNTIPYGGVDGVVGKRWPMHTFLSQMLNGTGRAPGSGGKTNLSALPPLYLFDQEMLKQNPALRGDLAHHIEMLEGCDITSLQFTIGPEASGSPVHFHMGAINVALFGRKRWLFYPPADAYWSRKPTLPWLMEGDAYTSSGNRPMECVQEPGDVVYVPMLFGHAVINTEDAVAVAMELNERVHFTSLY
jgi:hypothetical protein